jgi:beta-glucosidase-like glycosyl hydrolase
MKVTMKHLLPVLTLALMFTTMTVSAQSTRWVDSTLASLTLEERVGQLFVVELAAIYTHESDQAYRYALDMIHNYHVGTFILGGGNVLDIPVIANRLQNVSKVPLFINGDLEAGMTYGTPWRLSRGWTERLPRFIPGGGTQFISQMGIGATGNPQFAYELGRITALEARAVGIHWSNSPVADVNSNAENPIINTRSYGEDPALVARMVAAYVRGARDGKMLSTLKHFPGHGDTRDDSHMKLPVLPANVTRLDSMEFVPFKAGIVAGAGAVMTSHLSLPRIDSTGRPATLSRPVMTGLLRDHLGFRGIIVTDGMRMQGITDHFNSAEASVYAIEAGVDAVLGIEDIDQGYNGVLQAVRSGRLSEERINASVRRMLSAKSWAGLDRQRTVNIDSIFTIVGDPRFQQISQEISDASITLLRDSSKMLPLPRTSRLQIVTVTEEPNATFGTELLNEVEPSVASATLVRISNDTGQERIAEIRKMAAENDAVVVGVYLSVVAWKGDRRFSHALEQFFASLPAYPIPVILVAFGDPYILGKLPTTHVVMTPYNVTYLAERSIARAVSGKSKITGKLPVTIPGRYPRGAGLER